MGTILTVGGDLGFLRDAAGMFTVIDVPGAADTDALGINDAGQIVGAYFDSNSGVWHGFLRDAAGMITTIDVPRASYTAAYGITNAGQIVGTFQDAFLLHGFLATPSLAPVPEPGSLLLFGTGLLGGGGGLMRRRRRLLMKSA